jgi:hypothetical protein
MQQDRVLTWVNFKWKKPVSVDQFSVERNILYLRDLFSDPRRRLNLEHGHQP